MFAPTMGPLFPTSGQVSAYVDDIQEQFLNILIMLSPFMDVSSSSLTFNWSFGLLYKRTSVMSADPMNLPDRLEPLMMPHPAWIAHQLRTRISDFVTSAKLGFDRLTFDIRGCIATMAIDVNVGIRYQTRCTMRVLPRRPGSQPPSTNPASNDDDSSPDLGQDEAGHGDGSEEIVYAPIPRGFDYFAQFPRQ